MSNTAALLLIAGIAVIVWLQRIPPEEEEVVPEEAWLENLEVVYEPV